MPVWRSMLFVPATKTKYQESAVGSGADAIILDLEDSVAINQKQNARQGLGAAMEIVDQSGADVLVRVNNEPEHLEADLEAGVVPGLSALMIPKVESAAEVAKVCRVLDRLEKDRSLEPQAIGLEVDIETAKGLVAIKEILSVSPRIVSVGFGAGDYCRDLGIIPSSDGLELLYAFSAIITQAKAAGIQARGMLGTLFDFRDLEGFERMAVRSRRLGSAGSPCIHPKQVSILNKAFSPSEDELAWARLVVDEFEKKSARGEAAFSLRGKMIDYANYREAKDLLTVFEGSEPGD